MIMNINKLGITRHRIGILLLILFAFAAGLSCSYLTMPGASSYNGPVYENNPLIFWRTIPMVNRDIENPSDPNPQSRLSRFKTLTVSVELLRIEEKLREYNLWEIPEIQQKYWLANYGTDKTRSNATQELVLILQEYNIKRMQYGDPYMPYAREDQISNNNQGIHILNQANNNIQFRVDQDKLLTGCLILGRQDGGKTYAAYNMLKQTTVPFVLLDPKCCWRQRASLLNATYIDLASFDLSPPPNITWEDWLFTTMEVVAQSTGLQYGLDLLIEASQIALSQRQQYIEKTGEDPSLCLKDIRLALELCNLGNSKRTGYFESSKTALSLLVGSEHNPLFSTRGGISLKELFRGRFIIGCPFLNSYQARFWSLYFFTYRHYQSIGLPETSSLRHLIVIDDASRFVSRPETIFSSGGKFGAWMHVLSVLRSSGTGYIFIDQILEPISDDIKQLTHFWLIVGGLRGDENKRQASSAMSLNKEQCDLFVRLQKRECICFCPAAYPYPIHGEIPIVT